MDSSGIAILTIIASIIGAIIAGLMTMEAAKTAAKDALENNLKLQKQAQNQAIRGVLLGLRTEISVIKSIYEAEIKNSNIEIKSLVKGQPFPYQIPINQNYFTIYESNAVLIGQIPDNDLIILIVEIYLRIKGVIDTHLQNNWLLDELHRLRYGSQKHFFDQETDIDSVQKSLDDYGINIKVNYVELLEVLDKFYPKVDLVIQKLSDDSISKEIVS